VIVTILGGSAQSTPALFEYLSRQSRPDRFCVRLAGRTRKRLAAVGRACKAIAPNVCVELATQENWKSSLSGADVVIIQVRIGGYKGREVDEARAIRFGSPGDEGLGLGGFSAALRTWPTLKQILAAIPECAPRSIALLLTSPSGLLMRLAAIEWPHWPLYGICELPYTTLKRVCDATRTGADDVTFGYTGVNHLGFLHSIRQGNRDVLSAYGEMNGIPFARFVRNWRAVPMKYFALHCDQAEILAQQRTREPRAQVLMRIQQEAMAAYQSGAADAIRRAIHLRRADWYHEAVGPFLLALTGDRIERPFFLTAASEDGAVRERPFRVNSSGIHAHPNVRAPEPVEAFTNVLIRYEKAAADAIRLQDRRAMVQALCLHPWMAQVDVQGYVNELLADERLEKVNCEPLCVN
jgi:6-phospho-beta-glucosidase